MKQITKKYHLEIAQYFCQSFVNLLLVFHKTPLFLSGRTGALKQQTGSYFCLTGIICATTGIIVFKLYTKNKINATIRIDFSRSKD